MKRQVTFSPDATLISHAGDSQRRGAIAMILVVAVMIIGSLLLTQGVRGVLNERRAMPGQFERQQAEHLLRAGVERLKKLPTFSDVQAGIWSFRKGILHADQSAEIQVSVKNDQVIVTARYPLEAGAPKTVSETLSSQDWAD